MATDVLVFAGSIRSGSFNARLAHAAADALEEAGASVTRVELKGEYEMPIYDGDLEEREGLPSGAVALKKQFAAHDALLLATPEYNGSITPLLKNAIDWVSRSLPDEKPLQSFRGKTAALISASPGRLGGMRSLGHVRTILSGIGVLVLPEQLTVASAGDVFDDDGKLTDERSRKRLAEIAERLVAVAGR